MFNARKPEKVYTCEACHWSGTSPSTTETKSVQMVDGRLTVDRTHLLVCPSCFQIMSRTDGPALVGLTA